VCGLRENQGVCLPHSIDVGAVMSSGATLEHTSALKKRGLKMRGAKRTLPRSGLHRLRIWARPSLLTRPGREESSVSVALLYREMTNRSRILHAPPFGGRRDGSGAEVAGLAGSVAGSAVAGSSRPTGQKKGAPDTAGARLRLSFRGAPRVRGAPPFLLLP